jgi:membrane fusion protein, multidrug efflux system
MRAWIGVRPWWTADREPDRSRSRGSTRRWRRTLLLIPFLVSGCGFEAPPDGLADRPVRIITLESPQDVVTYTFSGRAAAAERALLAFRVPGQLEEVLVDMGDRVEKGQVLARLDSRDYRLRVRELEAGLAAAEARLEQARAGHERGARLVLDDAISQAAFENVEALWQEARGGRDALREALATARAALQDTELRAPFGGFVSLRRAEPFELVVPQRPVFGLDRIDEIEVRVGIPELLMAGRARVRSVDVRFPIPDYAIPGRIKAMGVDVDPDIQTYPVRIAVDNAESRIIPGMTAEVTFHVALTNSPGAGMSLVPLTAVYEHDGRPHAWVLDPTSGRVFRRALDIGTMDRGGVYVRGVQAGEVIVDAGVHQLREGQAVRPLDRPLSGTRP